MDEKKCEINKFESKDFYASNNKYLYFLEKKENEESNVNLINKNIINNIKSNGKTNNFKSIRKTKIKYYKRNIIINLKRFKIFLLLYTINFILLNISEILCLSYIILKINKSGRHNILFKGDANDKPFCNRVPMHIPISMEINGNITDPPVADYEFTSQENTIKLVYEDTKTSFRCLFYKCSDIDEIDASNLNTSNANDMTYMFERCSSLTSLNVNNFNTEKISSMRSMFGYCSSLSSLNISHFNTPSLIDMAYVFRGCSNLTSIYLLNFNTKKVNVMDQLFYGCSSLTSLDISNFNTSKVQWMAHMFRDCYLLKTLNLSHFDTSSVIYFQSMFNSCISLISLDLSNFNTKNANTTNGMFYGCNNLKYLDLHNFDTSLVTDMSWMFNDCFSLESLDITNFNTSNVKTMRIMFGNCYSLTTLDVSHFDTSSVSDMGWIFYNCSNLPNINLSSFNTISVKNFDCMFEGCKSLESLNVSNFDTSNAINTSYMFKNCENIKSLNLNNFNTTNVENMDFMFYECFKLETLDLSSFITSNVKSTAAMFVRCKSLTTLDISKFNTSKVISSRHMFEDCSLITSLNLSKFRTSNIENMHAMFIRSKKLISLDLSNFDFSKVLDLGYMFAGCSELKYINIKSLIINDNIHYSSFIDNSLINPIICIDDIQSLKKIISLYQCQYLEDSENWGEYKNNVTNDNNIYIEGCLLSKKDLNCYQICSFYYYYDESINKYICTESLKCTEPYDKLIFGKNECVKLCSETNNYKYELALGKVCLTICPENFFNPNKNSFLCIPKCSQDKPFLLVGSLECVSQCTIKQRQNKLCVTYYRFSQEVNNNILNEVLSQTRNELLNDFDESVINGDIINENGDIIRFSRTTKYNMNDEDDIFLGECEDRLKELYHIPLNDSLYVLRLDINQIGMQIPLLEYEIYYPINNSKNLIKLDLSICSNLKIERVISINITGNIDKYNKSSPYYNDICYIVDSDYGTDISLLDRKEEYANNNMGICEDRCDFVSYNYETKKAVCSCSIKTKIPIINEIKIDKNTLLKSFIDINNIANIQMLKCYKIVFKKNNILTNLGCYIFSCLIIFNLLCFLVFVFKDYKSLVSKIYKLKKYFLNDEKEKKIVFNNTHKKNKKENFSGYRKIINSIDRKLQIKKLSYKPKISIKNKLSKFYSKPNNNNIKSKRKLNIKKNNNLIIHKNKIQKSNRFDSIDWLNKSRLDKNLNIMKLNNNEINHLTFNVALNKDKRTFIKYYLSLLTSNHLILNIFYGKDYNSRAIKVSIFIFNISSSIAINSLFFNDSTMHKLYTDHGSFDFLYQLPQIIYSTIISYIIDFLINTLGLSEQNILKIKNIFAKDAYKKFNNLLKILKIKFTLFFILDFILLFLFWYYVTCFCGIYRNTQIHLLKDSLSSFIISLITPFLIYLFPGLFRVCALRKKSKVLYKFSQILQTI